MLAYAANTPRTAGRAGSPKALTLIIAGHVVLIAAVMTAKMELIGPDPFIPIDTFNVPVDPPPPPPSDPTIKPQQPRPATQDSFIETERPIVPMDTTGLNFDQGKAIEDIATVIGTDVQLPPLERPTAPVKRAAVFRTADNAVKPPYPLDKRRLGEEATLKLRLTIDTRGRVTALEPIGAADPSFLEAARRHILRAWRYQPATEDGVAIPSSTVISLSFRLEDV
jgi:protein TonB